MLRSSIVRVATVLMALFITSSLAGCSSYDPPPAAPQASDKRDIRVEPHEPVSDPPAQRGPAWLNPSVEVYGVYQSVQARHLDISSSDIGKFSGAPLGRLSAFDIGTRSAVHLYPWLYFGLDIALGGGYVPTRVLRESPLVTTTNVAVHAHLGGVVGLTSPRFGPFDVRGDLFLGGRLLFLGVEERYGCTHDGCEGLFGSAWMVQPRGTLDVWVTPNVTVGAFGGADVLHPGDWSTALLVGYHWSPHDSGR